VLRSFEDILRLHDYDLPPGRIATAPVRPRDAAKFVVIDRQTGTPRWMTFRDLPKVLPKNSVLVLNDTKVIPARIWTKRHTGGKVGVLFLAKEGNRILALANRRLTSGEFLTISGKHGFTVIGSKGKGWLLEPSFPMSKLRAMFDTYGSMPLPPYIKDSPLTEKEIRREYQTVFAKKEGSIAAPTASLHFTDRLLSQLKKSGITIVRVTLHVHLGTFAPLTEEQWKKGKLHEESYVIDAKTANILEKAHREKRPIIAVGTTVMRTLESAADKKGRVIRPKGETRLFIREGYDFRLVSGLITNFHVPKSSLLMLVSTFLDDREQLLDIYKQAISHDFRFFSFGDAMMIL
jgi:S-adenosylmethionine:tRNA ribosyltransferase-isomerase